MILVTETENLFLDGIKRDSLETDFASTALLSQIHYRGWTRWNPGAGDSFGSPMSVAGAQALGPLLLLFPGC